MQDFHENTTSGHLKISTDVIETLTTLAISEIKGVHSLSLVKGGNLNLAGLISRSYAVKPITVEIVDDVVVIDVRINIFYGASIPAVAKEVQTAVKSSVQEMIGATVSRVNVYIANIIF